MQRGTIFADFHTHTTASDGAHTPTMLVQRAFERAIRAIAVTDHDTVAGVEEAREAALSRGMTFLSGIEISAMIEKQSATAHNTVLEKVHLQEVHILGYGFDETNRAITKYAKQCSEERTRRAEQILSRLTELGKPLSMEQVRAISGTGVIGRHHIATALRNAGMVRTVREAFDKYLADDAAAAVAKWTFSAEKAIELIHGAGGVAVLAHPAQVVSAEQLNKLMEWGLDGVEIHHPAHDGMTAQYYQIFANERQILASGGSDYHGGSKRDDSNLGRFGLVEEDCRKFLTHLNAQCDKYKAASKQTSTVRVLKRFKDLLTEYKS